MAIIAKSQKSPVQSEIDRVTREANSDVDANEIASNPLFLLEQGEALTSDLPAHKKSAKSGNLYFEYAQNVAQLRGVVRSGRDIAIYLESKDLIVYDRATDRYMWKDEPMLKSSFLRMVLKNLRSA